MIDRNGLDYAELLAIQKAHLLVWKLRIRAAMFDQIERFVLDTNKAAVNHEQKHQVWRGQDLVEIIRQWPDLSPAYKQPEPVNPIDLV